MTDNETGALLRTFGFDSQRVAAFIRATDNLIEATMEVAKVARRDSVGLGTRDIAEYAALHDPTMWRDFPALVLAVRLDAALRGGALSESDEWDPT